MYDLDPATVHSFIAKELTPSAYKEKEALGETYIVKQ